MYPTGSAPMNSVGWSLKHLLKILGRSSYCVKMLLELEVEKALLPVVVDPGEEVLIHEPDSRDYLKTSF